MDQLTVALRYLKRIHFWIICPLVTLMGIGAWYLAVGSLDEQKDENVGKIEGHYSTVQQLTSISPHPNSNVADAMEQLISKTQNEIKEAWDTKSAQQVGVLTWPEFPDWSAAQKRDFLRTVQPLRPIERMVKVDDPDRLNIAQRESFRDYIRQELPRLAKLAGSAWVLRGDEGASVVGNAAEQQANTIVLWKPESQKTIVERHFQWKTGRGTPSTLEILYAHEDLLVLRHLMQIISRTNEDATTRHSAAVRKILEINIGKEAVYSDVTVEGIEAGSGGGNTSPASASPDAEALPDPAEGRYVDKNYEPLPAETLRQVMEQDGELDPEQAYLAVAKRIPVRMRVSIDQRHINRLLVECANSELTVEVRQLLINPYHVVAQTARGGGGFGGVEGGGFGGRDGAPGGAESTGQFPFDLDVELYGIVSIYNPVDENALGIVSEEMDEEARAFEGTITR